MALLAGRYRNAQVVSLRQKFALLLLTEDLFDELAVASDDHQNVRDDRFLYLCSRTIRVAKFFSLKTPVAYVETDYFGGIGSQGAAVWANGELIFGPTVSASREGWADDHSGAVINIALQRIGVTKDGCSDEFEAIGLGTYRSNQDWLKNQKDL